MEERLQQRSGQSENPSVGEMSLEEGVEGMLSEEKTKTKHKAQPCQENAATRIIVAMADRTVIIELGCQNLRKQRINTQIPSYSSHGTLQICTW